MRKKVVLAVAALALLGAASSASAEVQLSLHDGRVTIIARDATVRQILMEWARIGHTKIVNVERIPGLPLTIELRDVPEQQALKVLLRSISGYVTAPRASMVADSSVFDRIIVMPTVAATPAPISAAPPPPPFATFQRPQELPVLDNDDERPTPPVPAPPPGSRGPAFFAFPPVQGTAAQPVVGRGNAPQQETPFIQNQQPGAVPTTPPPVPYPGAPTMPAGVSTPGMVVPAPAPQPGQQQPPPQQ